MAKINPQATPDEVHDLRTNARRFEAICEALSLDTQTLGKSTVKSLARFRKRAGKVRDMDVLTGYVSTVHVPGEEEECAVPLLEYLGAHRQKFAKKLYSEIKHHRKAVRSDLKRMLDVLAKRVRQNDNGRQGDIAAANATAAAVSLAVQLAAPRHLGKENPHPYRLKVKELRNVLQLAAGDSHPKFVEDLKQVKDAIGEWHDWGELIAIAQKALEHGNGCGLLAEMKKIANDNVDHALALAQRLRKDYLRNSHRKGKAAVGAAPAIPREMVWEAIARLA